MSHANSPGITSRHRLLQRVAVTLGVPVDAFGAPPEGQLFHIGADGTRWLLVCDAPGSPTVRCLSARNDDRPIEHEGVIAFVVRNLDSPQGQALAALVDRVLTLHLYPGIRS